MGSAPVGAQCPLTSSLGEFLGYRDWFWYPGLSPVLVCIALPFAFHISMFSIHYSSPAIGFHSSIFYVAVSAPHYQPSSLFQTWDWQYGNWISERVEIPWWWSFAILAVLYKFSIYHDNNIKIKNKSTYQM